MKGKEVVFSNEIQQGTKLRQSIKGQLESVNARLSSLEDDYARYQGGLESISAKNKKIQAVNKEIVKAQNWIAKLSSRRATMSSFVQKIYDLDFVLLPEDFFPNFVAV